ncbi:MAG: hypothetical protein FVQ80_06605 [Planctomycetes bacterium]|nr:hypothetical protein [Planctomycetota bacterium]
MGKTKQRKTYRTDVSKQRKKSEESSNKNAPIICDLRTYGKPCGYCKEADRLKAKEDKEEKDLGYRVQVRSTFYMNVVDLDHKAEGVRIYGSGIENWRTLIDLLPEDDQDDSPDFTNPDEACAVIIKRRGTGMTNTKYVLKLGVKTFKVPDKWVESAHDLSKVLSLIDVEGFELWKPREGRNNILILGPWSEEAEGNFYQEIFYHWGVSGLGLGADGEVDDFEDVNRGEEFEDDDFGADDDTSGSEGEDNFEY